MKRFLFTSDCLPNAQQLFSYIDDMFSILDIILIRHLLLPSVSNKVCRYTFRFDEVTYLLLSWGHLWGSLSRIKEEIQTFERRVRVTSSISFPTSLLPRREVALNSNHNSGILFPWTPLHDGLERQQEKKSKLVRVCLIFNFFYAKRRSKSSISGETWRPTLKLRPRSPHYKTTWPFNTLAFP